MGKKILLADDSITIQKVIELTFSDEDFEVVTVGNGRLAVEKVQDVRPDLVLCDIIMPEKDGYEVCDFIKKTPSLSHIPVLLLTGAFEPFDQDRATRVGCDGFLAKPFEPQTLIAKVKELLSQAATRTIAPPRPSAAAPAAHAPSESAPVPSGLFNAAAHGAYAAPAPPAKPAAPPAPAHDDFGAAEPSFISDEPLDTPTMITPTRFEVGRSVYDEPPLPPPTPPPSASVPADDLAYVDELPEPEELLDVSPEESATLQGVAPGQDAADDDMPAPWAQPTVEVSYEARARASVESAAAPVEASFDEVFEEDSASEPAHSAAAASSHSDAAGHDFGFVRPQDLAGSPAAPSAPSAAAPETVREGFGWVRQADLPGTPAAPPHPSPAASAPAPSREPERTPEPQKRAPEPLDVAPAPEASFAAVASAAPEPAPAPSAAAEVGVPVDMVEKIAQRVVAQISEKVIREIAWEVIPDLAENLIKQEIDRLKAELQSS